jgi:hypothetical protein
MYNNEAILLLIRLRTLSPLVDHFILGWSNTTFSGRDSEQLSFSPYENQIAAFNSQLTPLWFDVTTVGHDPWERPKAARNHLLEGVKLYNPRPGDLVMISDLDEFPLPATVRYLRLHPPSHFIRLRGHIFFASFRLQEPGSWRRNGVVRYGAISAELSWYRRDRPPTLPGLTALHCSYCFGRVKDIIRKFRTASHTGLSKGLRVDPNYIVARAACQQKPFGGDRQIELRDRDADLFGLDLPPEAEPLLWKLPFADLDEVGLDLERVKAMAKCPLNITDGKLSGYN